jgi:hypothetical protein
MGLIIMKAKNFFAKAMIAVVLSSGLAAGGLPAEPPASARTPANIAARITEKLGLDAAHQAAVESILQQSIEQRRAIFQKYHGQRGTAAMRSMHTELKPIRQETETRLKSVLTLTQMREFHRLQGEMNQQLRASFKGR